MLFLGVYLLKIKCKGNNSQKIQVRMSIVSVLANIEFDFSMDLKMAQFTKSPFDP